MEARGGPPRDAVRRRCCHVGMETGEGATGGDLPAGGGQVERLSVGTKSRLLIMSQSRYIDQVKSGKYFGFKRN